MTNRQYAMDLSYDAGYKLGHRAGMWAGLRIGCISSAAIFVIVELIFWLAAPAHAETCHDNTGRPYVAARCLPVTVTTFPDGHFVSFASPEPGCYVVRVLDTGEIDFTEKTACVLRKSTK